MRRAFRVLPLLLVPLGTALAEPPRLVLRLLEAQDSALKQSADLRAARLEAEAAESRARAGRSGLYPRLSLDGSWRYLSEVPRFAPLPGGREITLTDNEGYSLGPLVEWNAWDSGGLYHGWKSLQAAAEAERAREEGVRREVLLRTRLAYFDVQLAAEQVRLLAGALGLAQKQHADIRTRTAAGAGSRLDSLSAHQDVLLRRAQLREARGQLAAGLRELFSWTGRPDEADVSLPAYAGTDLPADTEPPTVLLELDPADSSRGSLETGLSAGTLTAHPLARTYDRLAASARETALRARSDRYPKVRLTAKTSLDYPNGPLEETVHQNFLGATLNLALFNAGRTARETEAEERRARALEERRADAAVELETDREKARDRLDALRSRRELERARAAEAEELASLTYDSYRGGRSPFIEVQTANYRALEAAVQAARTETQMLMQLAVLDSLK